MNINAHAPTVIAKAERLFKKNIPVTEIASTLDVPRSTVSDWVQRHHWAGKTPSTVLVISDLQCPYEHADASKFLAAVVDKYKPTEVVCIGDEADMAGLSSYPKDPDGFSPGRELEKTVEHLKPFYEMFPVCRVVTSNHTERIYRKCKDNGIPRAFLKDYGEFLQSPPGWTWQDHLEIGDARLEHGHLLPSGPNGAKQAPLLRGSSVVFGHLHTGGGILWVSTPQSLWYSFNVGCLINPHHPVFSYANKARTRPTLGTGIIHNGLPIWVPMMVIKGGRWTGELLG